jgi:hypothetical protein
MAGLCRLEHMVALQDRASLAEPFVTALKAGVGKAARPGTPYRAMRQRLIAHM